MLVVGTGFFGGVVARRLAETGIRPVTVSRRGGDVRADVEDRASLESVLREGDVVVDTAGPFQSRTTALIESAIARGCDVVDLSDALGYAEHVLALDARAAAAGSRVLTSCSAIATVAAVALRAAGCVTPESCDIFLAPASAETGNPATVRAFLASVGAPIRVRRDGALVGARGWSEWRRFPREDRRGGLVESAAAVLLPRSWPSLRRVDFWVDANVPLAGGVLALAARARRAALALAPLAAPLSRLLGRRAGVFAVAARERGVERTVRLAAPARSWLIAAEPAVLAAASLARGGPLPAGVVLAHAQVDPQLLFARLRAVGVDVRT